MFYIQNVKGSKLSIEQIVWPDNAFVVRALYFLSLPYSSSAYDMFILLIEFAQFALMDLQLYLSVNTLIVDIFGCCKRHSWLLCILFYFEGTAENYQYHFTSRLMNCVIRTSLLLWPRCFLTYNTSISCSNIVTLFVACVHYHYHC